MSSDLQNPTAMNRLKPLKLTCMVSRILLLWNLIFTWRRNLHVNVPSWPCVYYMALVKCDSGRCVGVTSGGICWDGPIKKKTLGWFIYLIYFNSQFCTNSSFLFTLRRSVVLLHLWSRSGSLKALMSSSPSVTAALIINFMIGPQFI